MALSHAAEVGVVIIKLMFGILRPVGDFLERRLSRKTSGRALIPEIDGLRSIAIVSVVLFHAAGNFRFYALGGQKSYPGAAANALDAFLKTGEYGVPLFFAISGFILGLPFASRYLVGGKPVNLGKYLWRRVTRLEPPYFFALGVLFAINVVENQGFENFPNLLASMFYVHNFAYGEPSAILVVAWSLEVEVQFYLCMPVLALLFAIRPAFLRRLLIGAMIVGFSVLFGEEKPIAGRMLWNQAPYFLVGLLLADFYLSGWLQKPHADTLRGRLAPKNLAWDAAAVVSLSMVFGVHLLGWAPVIATPLLILAGYVAVFRGGLVRALFRWKPVVILGGMCYTIYLWHFLFIAGFRVPYFRLVQPDAGVVDLVTYLFATGAFSIGLSAVLFALIERPTMDPKWLQKTLEALKRIAGGDRPKGA